jgi:putative transcriptional regulator
MSKTSFSRKRGAPFHFSDSERRRLKNVTAAEVEVRALSGPENLPVSQRQLDRMSLAREVRLVREKTGLSQALFAGRFRIGVARLRDFEQGRSEPDFVVRVFFRMILEAPATADRLIKSVERKAISEPPGR